MPADRYQDIDEDRLSKLYDGLDVLESIALDAVHDLDLFLYGLTQSESIIDAAKEAIADDADLDESDVQLSEVAVAIPISGDSIRALMGSGFRARQEDFAYMGTEGEGIRAKSFVLSHYKPVLAVSEFSQMALAQSDAWLDDFLKQYGNKQPAEIKQNVRRTEEATQPGVPAAPAAPTMPPPTPAAAPAIHMQSSQTGGLKLADILENFLG
jgi:hypothetical protein